MGEEQDGPSDRDVDAVGDANDTSAVGEKLIDVIQCCVCAKIIETEAIVCDECHGYFHFTCTSSGEEKLCPLCKQSEKLKNVRSDTGKRIRLSAEKMKDVTRKHFSNLKVGDSVMLRVPKVDRGPTDSPNLICVILREKNDVFQVGCEKGIIKGWYGPETLIPMKTSFLRTSDVDGNIFLSLRHRHAVSKTTGGQGYTKCNCKASKQQCRTKRCACFNKKRMCTSRCNNSLSCLNK